ESSPLNRTRLPLDTRNQTIGCSNRPSLRQSAAVARKSRFLAALRSAVPPQRLNLFGRDGKRFRIPSLKGWGLRKGGGTSPAHRQGLIPLSQGRPQIAGCPVSEVRSWPSARTLPE